jgi:hypothetical protein
MEIPMMKRRLIAVAVLTSVVVVLGVAVWATYVDLLNQVKHETNRWAVIEDSNGSRIAVEPISNHVWLELVQLNQNETRMWVGGIVERYDNKWGFRFKPDSVTVAEVTAEGLQTTIKDISTNIDYWLNLGWAYVWGKVAETLLET